MQYRKVYSSTRFSTKSGSNFIADSKLKRILIGTRKKGKKAAYIGKVYERGNVSNLLDYGVYCDIDFPHVIGIFGSRGSGKSFDLGVFLESIFMLQDQGTTDAGIVFDVQDQFWTLAHHPSDALYEDQDQIRDLMSWGLEPLSKADVHIWVPSSSDTQIPGAQVFSIAADQLTGADWLSILELERFSAMGQVLLTLLEDIGPATPKQLADTSKHQVYQSEFQQSTLDGVRWRLNGLHESGVISAQGIEIDELLRPGKLTIILMRNLQEAIRGLVVGVISRLVADRLGRAQQARRVARRVNTKSVGALNDITGKLWLVVDEAHVLVPTNGETAATAPLIDYVKRGRDAGLSLIFATQQPSAVDSRLMSQVDLTITHTLGFDADLSAAAARMPTRTSVEYEVNNQKTGNLNDVIRSLGTGEAFVADGASDRIFVAKIRPRVSAHGGSTPE